MLHITSFLYCYLFCNTRKCLRQCASFMYVIQYMERTFHLFGPLEVGLQPQEKQKIISDSGAANMYTFCREPWRIDLEREVVCLAYGWPGLECESADAENVPKKFLFALNFFTSYPKDDGCRCFWRPPVENWFHLLIRALCRLCREVYITLGSGKANWTQK